MIQEEERGDFRDRRPAAERSTTLEEAEAFFLECEAIIETAARNSVFPAGLSNTVRPSASSRAFSNPRTTDLSPREVTKIVLERLPKRPGITYYTGQESEGDETGEQVQVVTLYGEDAEQLETTAEDLEPLFTAIPGVLGSQGVGRSGAHRSSVWSSTGSGRSSRTSAREWWPGWSAMPCGASNSTDIAPTATTSR